MNYKSFLFRLFLLYFIDKNSKYTDGEVIINYSEFYKLILIKWNMSVNEYIHHIGFLNRCTKEKNIISHAIIKVHEKEIRVDFKESTRLFGEGLLTKISTIGEPLDFNMYLRVDKNQLSEIYSLLFDFWFNRDNLRIWENIKKPKDQLRTVLEIIEIERVDCRRKDLFINSTNLSKSCVLAVLFYLQNKGILSIISIKTLKNINNELLNPYKINIKLETKWSNFYASYFSKGIDLKELTGEEKENIHLDNCIFFYPKKNILTQENKNPVETIAQLDGTESRIFQLLLSHSRSRENKISKSKLLEKIETLSENSLSPVISKLRKKLKNTVLEGIILDNKRNGANKSYFLNPPMCQFE